VPTFHHSEQQFFMVGGLAFRQREENGFPTGTMVYEEAAAQLVRCMPRVVDGDPEEWEANLTTDYSD